MPMKDTRRQPPFGRFGTDASRQHRGVVQPGRTPASAALPQLLGVSCLGGALLYASLVHLNGWRTGTILGAVLLVGPLIEAVSPGFVGKLQGGAEQAQRAVHGLAVVVLLAAAAVFAWMWVAKPHRHATPVASRISSPSEAQRKALLQMQRDPEFIERWRRERQTRRPSGHRPAGDSQRP